jgi:pimeloyl-ACP methyl ester carboxylesterase
MHHSSLNQLKCPSLSKGWTLFLFLCALSFQNFAQPVYPVDWGLKQFIIKDKKLGDISFHVDTTKLKQKAPLLIYTNGSGGYPLVIYHQKQNGGGQMLNTFDVNIIPTTKNDYHLILLDKPGVQFCDTITSNDNDTGSLLENYPVPEYYSKNLSLTWRVEAIKAVITYMIKNGYYDGKKLVVWGFSEGGQVVPRLAAEDKRVTHVVSEVGAGLNQFYDFIMVTRIKIAKGQLTHEEGQKEIDEMFKTIQDIYADPTSTTKFFSGHTYKRWASFCLDAPIESLIKLDIPIYMLVGSADVNSPIYGLDYVPLEFLRRGKKNLTYEVCVGCDHFQNVIQPSSPDEKGKSRGDEFMTRILEWLSKK